MSTRVYGWKPDIPDHRDHLFSLTVTTLPDHVDRLGMGNPIEDQGNLGSCTGNAATSAAEIVTNHSALSRLMAYYDGRAIEGTVRYDSGCYIRDVIKGLVSTGCCAETLWPYVISKYKSKPTKAAYADAKSLLPLVSSYERITSLTQVKVALSVGLPVIFGFSVPAYFESQQVATDGWVRMPVTSDQMIGGHAVVAVGYDDRVTSPFSFMWVRNSWSAGWGVQGYFKMDQRWFSDPRGLVDDMWVVHPKV